MAQGCLAIFKTKPSMSLCCSPQSRSWWEENFKLMGANIFPLNFVFSQSWFTSWYRFFKNNFLASQNSGEILHSWNSVLFWMSLLWERLYFWRSLSCSQNNEKNWRSHVEPQERALRQGTLNFPPYPAGMIWELFEMTGGTDCKEGRVALWLPREKT